MRKGPHCPPDKLLKKPMKLIRLSLLKAVLYSLFLLAHAVLAQGVTFVTKTLPVGPSPTSVAVADINGDGKLDLISANAGTNTLTIWTNVGNGCFGSNTTVTVDRSPACVVAADVNGDGKVDLICANYGYYTLTVLTNDGTGSFGSNATLNVGFEPICVAVADINGDGKPDLITTSGGSSSPITLLTVLTNNGSGFGFKAYSGGGHEPVFLAVADMNNDGHPDLISANFADNSLTVLTNDGTGGFRPYATLNVGRGPHSVAVADINGDGKLDLISANDGTNTLTVLTNNGNGGWGYTSTLNVGSYPYYVVAADVNGDGHADLISANHGTNTLTVLISAPTLTISRLGTDATVSWQSSWAGWTLQQNDDLATTNWSACTGIADDGTNRSLTVSLPTSSRFFRLSYP